MMQLSACVTPNAVPHPSQWLWRFRGYTLYHAHKKYQNSVSDSTISKTVVTQTLIQAPVLLECSIMRLLIPLRSRTKSLSLDSYEVPWYFFPLRLPSLRVLRWSTLGNAPPPVTDQTSSALPHWELKYLSYAEVDGFRSLSPDLLTGIVLRDLMMGERVFVFPKKR